MLLPALLYGEARGESLAGQMAVLCVVRNRVNLTAALLQRRGNTDDLWRAIITKPWAFSCFDARGGNWNSKKVVAFSTHLASGQPLDQLGRQVNWMCQGVRADAFRDITAGATHYFVRGSPTPHWAVGRAPVATIDSHDFYRLPERDFR